MLFYDEDGILARLESLAPPHRSAFALGLAERWLPAFYVFSETAGQGDASAIRGALECCWGVLAGSETGPVDEGPVSEQLKLAVACDGKEAEAAQAAAYCASYAVLSNNAPGNPHHAMYAARWVYNGIDAWLGYELGAELTNGATSPRGRKEALGHLDDAILAHHRMQLELRIIDEALSELTSLASGGGDLLRCRERWVRTWSALL